MNADAGPSAAPIVGFVGLGLMGAAIARRLLAAGIPLVVYNRTAERARPLVEAGAARADRPVEVGRRASSGVVFVMVSDFAAVRSVLFGRGGLARGMPAGGLVVDLSTVTPDQSRTEAERLSRRGVHFLDAPVGGSTDLAAEGRLTVFAGGAAADLDRARPYFDRFAARIEPMGDVGSGTSMKLVNNLLTIGHVALAAEALSLAEGLGLGRARVTELLLAGGGRSAMLERKSRMFLERKYPVQFKLRLADKDVRLVEAAGRAAGRSTRLSREVRRLYDAAIAAGRGDEDFAAVFDSVRPSEADGAGAVPAPSPPP